MTKNIVVKCEVVDSETSASAHCCFTVSALRRSALIEGFPFVGQYHLRLKARGDVLGLSKVDYAWVDLVDGMQDDLSGLVGNNNTTVEVKALVLSAPKGDEKEMDEYLQNMAVLLANNREEARPANNNNTTSSNMHSSSSDGKIKTSLTEKLKLEKITEKTAQVVQNFSLNNVKASASSIWNSVKATAAQLQNTLNLNASSLSDNAEENLAYYSEQLQTPYSDKNPSHVSLLQEVWAALFVNNKTFQRDSMQWKDAGFQTTDPVNDLKTSGILALQALNYMARTYPQRTLTMLQSNRENVKTKYPFAIVCVNVTLLLADVLNLKDQKYLSVSAGYWEMFEDRNSLFELFCLCFFHIDKTWTDRKAVRADYGKMIAELKTIVSESLSDSPRSLPDFVHVASSHGLQVTSD